MFLSSDQVAELTGRKLKSLQCEQLRRMGIPFFVNANGRPIVTCSAIEGGVPPPSVAKGWKPAVLDHKKAASR